MASKDSNVINSNVTTFQVMQVANR